MKSSAIDVPRLEAAVRELLLAIGADPDEAELAGTPTRVASTYVELLSTSGDDPADLLRESIDVGAATSDLVIVRDLRFRSLCPHHLLPFTGAVHVAYAPRDRIVGLSAIPRVIDTLAGRLQVQEVLTERIAEAMMAGLEAYGVLVVAEARQGCVSERGVRQDRSTTVTVAGRGVLADPVQRAAAMAAIHGVTTAAVPLVPGEHRTTDR